MLVWIQLGIVLWTSSGRSIEASIGYLQRAVKQVAALSGQAKVLKDLSLWQILVLEFHLPLYYRSAAYR